MNLTGTTLTLTEAELLECVEYYWRHCGHARADIEKVMISRCAWCKGSTEPFPITHTICPEHQAEFARNGEDTICDSCNQPLRPDEAGLCAVCLTHEKAAQKRQDELDDKMIGDV